MSDVRHPLFARLFACMLATGAGKLVEPHRRELLAGLSGRVIEPGAGTGANFALYPPSVTEVVAVEPEPYMRRRALRAAAEAPVPVRVVDGVADALPAADGEFDAVVASLMLCSVPDPARALAEMRRVLRPGGELRFYEHVAARDGRLGRTQAALSPVWPWLAGGCHLDRDTLTAIESAGFEVTRVRQFDFAPSIVMQPVKPHVIGAAVR